MKIRPVGAESMRTNGRTKLIAVFRNFANAPKNRYFVIRKQLRISCAEFGRQMTMQSVL